MKIWQRFRVPVGFLYGAVSLYYAQPEPLLYGTGIALYTIGLGLRLSASGYLKKFHRLAIHGPYQWTRNPLYLGSFLIGLGFSLASSRLWLILLFLFLFLTIYLPVIIREEEELEQTYGKRYTLYQQEVPRFWPQLRKSSRSISPPAHEEDLFLWRQVLLNREYKAVIGVVILALVMLIKMVWR